MAGRVTSAIIIAKNDTETDWFATLARSASAIVFVSKSLKSDLQVAHAIIYIGKQSEQFLSNFEEFGWGIEIPA
jgi:hypothetical protein